MALGSLGGAEASSVAAALQLPADKYGNDETLEIQWAMKAYQHAETYFNLITAVDPINLRLTKIDNEIYTLFRQDFPDLKVDVLDVEEMKSTDGKQKWREFCNQFEGQVEDWNMATLLRVDCAGDVSEDNTTLAPRIQFLAIEVSRNREGLNSPLKEKFKPEKRKDSEDTKGEGS